MKKLIALLVSLASLFGFVSCSFVRDDSPDVNDPEHEHKYEYIANEYTHFLQCTCGCESPDIAEMHLDSDGDGKCDMCGHEIKPTDIEEYTIVYEGMEDLLLDGFSPVKAVAGEEVVIKTHSLTDVGLELFVNGFKAKQVYAEHDYWTYVFTMPSDDVVITKRITDGMIVVRNFLRNLAGAGWIDDFTADAVSSVKISTTHLCGPSGSRYQVWSTTHVDTIGALLEQLHCLEATQEIGDEEITYGGNTVRISILLKDSTEYKLSIRNGKYYDGQGSRYSLRSTPRFESLDNCTLSYKFFSFNQNATVYTPSGSMICEISLDELEFVEITTAPDVEPCARIETAFDTLVFLSESVFFCESSPDKYYRLIGSGLYELAESQTRRK